MNKLLPSLLLVFLFLTCDKKKDPAPQSANEPVNSWIYGEMASWYYWASTLPTTIPDKAQEPEMFFTGLLNPNDRFSWIQDDFTDLVNSLRGVSKEGGFEFALYRTSASTSTLIMQILYIKHNSPAQKAGLKRGDVVTSINGTEIQTTNYESLLKEMSSDFVISYRHVYSNTTFGPLTGITIAPIEYTEDPNFMSVVFDSNDRKIGYYVYNLFSEGPEEFNSAYTTKMENIFGVFKSAGITDLILDLRFNSGGAVSAAQQLASFIAPNVTGKSVFLKYEYNEDVTEQIKGDPDRGEQSLILPFLAKSQNIGSQLRDNRVYILTSSRTASASELIINGLRPYMDVFLIGEVTVGKNVGSVSLYQSNNPNNKWGIQLIAMKFYNKDDQSDYSTGFQPQVSAPENNIYLREIGDKNERLLSLAIQQIQGSSSARETESSELGELLFHSLDLKKRSGIVTVDLPF